LKFELRELYWEGDIIEGELILSKKPISFLGDVDTNGFVVAEDSDIKGEKISGRIFAFPFGRGSTVGTYIMLQLAKKNLAPIALINKKTESIIATGAVISNIPLFDSPNPDLFDIKPGIYKATIKKLGEHVILNLKR